MKKRVLAALAAAVLLATASAASADGYVTLAELSKQAAEEGWRQVYEVDGKTLVTDASIKLPSAESCPILRLEPIGRDESDGVFDAYRAQKNAQIAADDKALTWRSSTTKADCSSPERIGGQASFSRAISTTAKSTRRARPKTWI